MTIGLLDTCLSKPMIAPAIIAQRISDQSKGKISKIVLKISIAEIAYAGRFFKLKKRPTKRLPDLACKSALLSADFLKNNKVTINVTESTIFLDGAMGYMVYIGNCDY